MYYSFKFLVVLWLFTDACRNQDAVIIEEKVDSIESGQRVVFQRSQIYYPQTCEDYWKYFPNKVGYILVNSKTYLCEKPEEISSSAMSSRKLDGPIKMLSPFPGGRLLVVDEKKTIILTITQKDLGTANKEDIRVKDGDGHCLILEKYLPYIKQGNNEAISIINLENEKNFPLDVSSFQQFGFASIVQLVALPDIDVNTAQVISYAADGYVVEMTLRIKNDEGVLEALTEMFQLVDIAAIDHLMGNTIAGSLSGKLVLQKSNQEIIENEKAHDDAINDIVILNNDTFVTCGEDRKIKIWSIQQNKMTYEFEYAKGKPKQLAKLTETTFAVGTGADDQTVRVFNSTTGRNTLIINHDAAISMISKFEDTFVFADIKENLFIYN